MIPFQFFTFWTLLLWILTILFKKNLSNMIKTLSQNMMITIGLIGFIFVLIGHNRLLKKYTFLNTFSLLCINIFTHIVPIIYILYIQNKVLYFSSQKEFILSLFIVIIFSLIYLYFYNPKNVYFFIQLPYYIFILLPFFIYILLSVNLLDYKLII